MIKVLIVGLTIPIFLLSWVDTAAAWVCWPPIKADLMQIDVGSLSETEQLRLRSKVFYDYFSTPAENEIAVIGTFARNEELPFLFYEQLEDIRSLYWPPSETVQMPHKIEHTYGSAYSFTGYHFVNGKVAFFATDQIDVRLIVQSDYEGIASTVPPMGETVIGRLRKTTHPIGIEMVVSFCPEFYPISASQLDDMLDCIDEGECSSALKH